MSLFTDAFILYMKDTSDSSRAMLEMENAFFKVVDRELIQDNQDEEEIRGNYYILWKHVEEMGGEYDHKFQQ